MMRRHFESEDGLERLNMRRQGSTFINNGTECNYEAAIQKIGRVIYNDAQFV